MDSSGWIDERTEAMYRTLAPAPGTRVPKPASDKQRAFIEKLLDEKDTTGTSFEGWQPDWSKATTKTASQVIERLLAMPRRREDAGSIKAGVYWAYGDQLYRVYFGQRSGRMLAKRINAEDGVVSYEYVGAAARVLTPDATPQRLSLEEVKEMSVSLGIQHDHCMICGQRIDVPESVDRGIGPVCAKKY